MKVCANFAQDVRSRHTLRKCDRRCAMSSVHVAVCIVQCAVYSVYCTLCSVQCTGLREGFIVECCVQYVHYLHIVYCVQCSLSNIYCALWCSVHQCATCGVQCDVCT